MPSIESLRDALSLPDVYPHTPERVELRQTHISVVALVPPRVYKIKKPVEMGFLDFSTLEARKEYCEREVELNRRLCDGVYETVVPIVETADGLRVDPDEDVDGEIVEWAVRMRYLERDGFLDRSVDDGSATPEQIDRIARVLAAFYDRQDPDPAVAEAGWIENLRVNTDENFAQTEDLVGDVLSRPAYDALRYATDRFYDQHAALLHRRRAGGHVLDCHGDLRLEHVHLTEERVCIYDCIEFNERFRHIDVASDVAFLAMDLDVHGRPDLGRHWIRAMADARDDADLPLLVDFYKSYRAYVRGKVEGMRAAEGEVPANERSESRSRARHYFQWALRYAVCGTDPMVVIVMGRSGTGKSTQAQRLASALGWPRISSDRVRKTKAGLPLHIRPDAAARKRLYTASMSDAVYATLRTRAVERGRQHRGVVLDATYSSRNRRDRLRTALQDAGIPYLFVELTAPDDVLRERLDARSGQATVSDARAEDFDLLSSRYDAPDALEDARHVRIDSQESIDATTTDALQAMIRADLAVDRG